MATKARGEPQSVFDIEIQRVRFLPWMGLGSLAADKEYKQNQKSPILAPGSQLRIQLPRARSFGATDIYGLWLNCALFSSSHTHFRKSPIFWGFYTQLFQHNGINPLSVQMGCSKDCLPSCPTPRDQEGGKDSIRSHTQGSGSPSSFLAPGTALDIDLEETFQMSMIPYPPLHWLFWRMGCSMLPSPCIPFPLPLFPSRTPAAQGPQSGPPTLQSLRPHSSSPSPKSFPLQPAEPHMFHVHLCFQPLPSLTRDPTFISECSTLHPFSNVLSRMQLWTPQRRRSSSWRSLSSLKGSVCNTNLAFEIRKLANHIYKQENSLY